jgi:uncharacterized protein with NRDE domain
MCTLVAFVGMWPEAPLVVAANRDERIDRAASGPRWWEGEEFLAPRDEEAGGTWLGLNDARLFVGVTNRAGAPRDPARTSRGQLVVEALRLGSAREVHEALATVLDGRRYNPFHLFYADAGGEAFVTWYDGDAVRQQALARGLAIVTERSLGGDDRGRSERIRARVQPLLGRGTPPSLEDLAPVMREHDEAERLAATCVHVPELGYGTRSSLLLDVRIPPSKSRWLWADGPPCVTPYVEIAMDSRG